MEISKREKTILEKYFKIDYEDKDYIDLENWTNGGVDMFITIDRNSNDSVPEQLEQFIDNFNIDEEIDIHRESEDYKNNFTIKDSINDFECWLEDLQNIINELEENKKEITRFLLQDECEKFYTDLIEFDRPVNYKELFILIEDCKNRLKGNYTNEDIYSAINRLGVPYTITFIGILDKITY